MKACLGVLAILLTLGGLTGAAIYLGTTPEEQLGPTELWLAKGGMDLLLYGGGALAAVLFVGWGLRRRARQRASWAAFASEHGFAYEGASSWVGLHDRVSGTFRGRALTLTVQQASESGEQTLTLELRGLPEGLSIRPTGGAAPWLHAPPSQNLPRYQPRVHVPTVETGDEAFDRAASVTAPDPEAARAWLTERRRAALLECLGHGDQHLANGGLVHVREGRSAEASELEEALHWLNALAEKLEEGGE